MCEDEQQGNDNPNINKSRWLAIVKSEENEMRMG